MTPNRQNFMNAPQWISNEMERVMRNVFGQERTVSPTSKNSGQPLPALNVWETEAAYTVEISVPGLAMADLEVLVNGPELVVKGERKATELPQDAKWLRVERPVGEFARAVEFETPVDAEHVQASLQNGVLTVVLPKAASARPRKIEIKG